jgi:hypothetical protein
MDVLTLVFRLPLLPVRGLVRLAEVIQDQAEQELHSPASVRRQLEEIEEARAQGAVSDEEVARVQGQALGRLVPPRATAPGPTETR